MIRKRMARAFGVAVAAASIALGVVMVAPVANARPLSNGLDVTCTADSDVHTTCIIGGCPRVNGDYVVDAVHVMFNGIQDEFGFKCINGETARWGHDGGQKFTIGVQGCRKKDLEADWCGPWADYTYTPPAAPPPPPPPPADIQCPAGSETPTVPAGQQCKAAPKPDIQCPPGSPTPTVPAGQTCAPIPDVTNAIQASFGAPGPTSVDFNVTNTSNIEATCNYAATANSLNPLVPKKTTRQFNIPANGNHTETFSGAITFTTYNVELSCKDASGKQKAELGHVTTSLTW
jgi:hypothetical protein